MNRRRLKPNRERTGWCIWRSTADGDKLVEKGMNERTARARVRRLNELLNDAEGIPAHAPFDFYFAHHGGYVSSPRDRGLDQWIDGEHARERGYA